MSSVRFDVLGIGNAIVDVLSQADDLFINAEGLTKGAMQLIDQPRAEALYERMAPGVEASGGSAANTIAGIASFGGKAAFIGKVANDQLGRVFRHDLVSAGIHYETVPLVNGPPTGTCLVLITPDAERTMNTHLGASVLIESADIDEALIADAQVLYLEGYLFDPAAAKAAFYKAARVAQQADRKVALSLSDSFCVERHRDEFRELIKANVDILFANEAEIKALYQTEDLEQAINSVRTQVGIACITRAEKGSIIISAERTFDIRAEPVSKVVDTTGAGDLYAAGFLYGFTQGHALPQCGHLGAIAAGEVISHVGPRPSVKLSTLMAEVG